MDAIAHVAAGVNDIGDLQRGNLAYPQAGVMAQHKSQSVSQGMLAISHHGQHTFEFSLV